MKLFLSSKGFANDELIEKFISFSELRKTVSIITTAAQKFKELNRNNIKLKERFEYLGYKTKFIDIEHQNPKLLTNTELIAINGGNPYYLLYHLRKSKSDIILKDLIENQVPVKGISAGSLILMNNLSIIDLLTPELNTIDLTDNKGLDIIQDVIIPHYDRFIINKRISKELIDRFESESLRNVIRLGENQCLVYTGKTKELFGKLLA